LASVGSGVLRESHWASIAAGVGKLSSEKHLNIFRRQFPNVDTNRDGKITSEDKKKAARK